MMIPPPHFEAPPGVRVYAHDPVLADVKSERGDLLGGRRIDRVSYTFDKPGDYVLPAAEVGWLDPATGKQQVSTTPPIEVSVAAAAAGAPAIAPQPATSTEPAARSAPRVDWARWGPWLAALALALLLGAWCLRRAAPHVRSWREARRKLQAEAEAAYFRRVESACRADDARAAYHALAAWSRRIGAASMAAVSDDAAYQQALGALERGLFGATGAPAWQGSSLGKTIAAARRPWLAQQALRERQAAALPALNP